MNLLGRRRGHVLLGSAIVGILVFSGCKQDEGLPLPPGESRTEVQRVTLTLPISTVYFDSLRTDKTGRLIVGGYSDPTFGRLHGTGYAALAYKSGSLDTASASVVWLRREGFSDQLRDFTFDGAKMKFRIDRAITSQTSFSQQIDIHRLTETIRSEGIYLRDRQMTFGELIAQGSIDLSAEELEKVNLDSLKVASIPFSEDFAEILFTAFVDDGPALDERSIRISSANSDALVALNLFSDSTEVQLFWKANIYDTASQTVKKDTSFVSVRFRLNLSKHFSNVERDFSSSIFGIPSDGQELDISPEFVYINSLMGLYPIIDLNPFFEFSQQRTNLIINRARLKVPYADEDPIIWGPLSVGYFFTKTQDPFSVNWPSQLRNDGSGAFYNTVMQDDPNYARLAAFSNPVITFLDTISTNPLTRKYEGTSTLFWQLLYDKVQLDMDEIGLEDRSFIFQSLSSVEDLVLREVNNINQVASPTVGQGRFRKDEITLELIYTIPRLSN